MAEFSPFVQQAQQCGRSDVSLPRSPSTQTCLAGLKMKQGLKLLHTHFFYLSIVEVIQNERKANFTIEISRANERVMIIMWAQ